MKKQLSALLVALISALTMKAQNFDGHYIIQSKEMLNGKEYLNAIANEITISQTKDSIKIVRVTPAANDQVIKTTETIPLDGNEIVDVTSLKRKKVSSINFDNGKGTITITTTYSYVNKSEEVEFKNVEVWDRRSDGTLIIIKTSNATISDDWTIKALYKIS